MVTTMRWLTSGLCAATLGAVMGSTQASDPPRSATPGRDASGAQAYQPRGLKRLRRKTRVASGAVRRGSEEVVLRVLASEHTGLTSRDQPRLYWFTARTLERPVEILLDAPSADADEPLFSQRLQPPFKSGVHPLDLAAAGVRLAPGVEYEWKVLALDARGHSGDAFAEATIRYEPLPAALAAALTAAPPQRRARLFAQAGYWYDAVETVNAQFASPGDAVAAERDLQGLLRDASLDDVARSGPLP